MTVTPGDSINVTIGLGGYSAKYGTRTYSWIDGTNGEPSSFGDIIAHGGDFGKSAYGSYSFSGGAGGDKYTKGGNGADARSGNQKLTSGVNGVLINGEYYGSSGGAGNCNYDSIYVGNGSPGGSNAGKGKTLDERYYGGVNDMDENGDFLLMDRKAPDSYGGGGGAGEWNNSQPQARSGGSGCVILMYSRYK